MAAITNIQYPSAQFSTQILGSYNNFLFGGTGGDREQAHKKTLRLTLPTIDYGDTYNRYSLRSNGSEFQGTPRKISNQHFNSLCSENIQAPFGNQDPPKTAETIGKISENVPISLPPCSLATSPTKGSTAHMIYKQYRQLFASRGGSENTEDRYVHATKNSRKLPDFPGVRASPAPMCDRQEEQAKRRSARTTRRDIRWYPNTSETITPNWDRTFTYSDTDVTFRERTTGSPSKVMSTVIQLPTIFNDKTTSRDKYIVKWLHSVPDSNPYAHSRSNSRMDRKLGTPMSLKTVDSYFIDTSINAKPSSYSP
ncbi:uncharacterized protein LOC121431098 [Lytechinus variegatus]|uniref:uncharacterized protein LOC121431098 n=1 Tax=Lytechinus variegatus TaxID=7654 RepID=UPI001BB22680|nr:uncharacterized protein LOC121431098 [Lytechinus variegatus]